MILPFLLDTVALSICLSATLFQSVAGAFSLAPPPMLPPCATTPTMAAPWCRSQPARPKITSASSALFASQGETTSGQADEPNLDEIQASADAIFAMIDSDANGSISYAELRSHLLDVCGYTQDAADAMYYALDANVDGSISRDELRMGFVRYESLRNAPGMMGRRTTDQDESSIRTEAEAMFDEIDEDKSGTIDNDELHAFLRRRGYGDNAIDNIYATLDVNFDGQISREELSDAFVRYSALRYATGALEADATSEFEL